MHIAFRIPAIKRQPGTSVACFCSGNTFTYDETTNEFPWRLGIGDPGRRARIQVVPGPLQRRQRSSEPGRGSGAPGTRETGCTGEETSYLEPSN